MTYIDSAWENLGRPSFETLWRFGAQAEVMFAFGAATWTALVFVIVQFGGE